MALLGMFMTLFSGYTVMMKAIAVSRSRLTQSALANEKIEIINNLPYDSVGIVSGVPAGLILGTESISRGGSTYTINTIVRNIDDPFDGVIDGAPDDLAPIDYKLVEVQVTCTSCSNPYLISSTARIAPPEIETATTNGLLLIRAFDATGTALAGANVHMQNAATGPTITVDDTTDSLGELRILGLPPATQLYQVSVTKSGYSTDQTLTVGAAGNPNPVKPHSTITSSNTTQVSFAIDRTSTLNVRTSDSACIAIPSIAYNLKGAKIIGTTPTVYKYNQNLNSGGSGLNTLTPIEWDTYTATLATTSYTIAGTIPLMGTLVSPNTSTDLRVVLAPRVDRNLLVTVVSGTTGLPLSDASVRLRKGAYDVTKTTGLGTTNQTSWSGGSGQATFTDITKYFSQDNNIAINNPAGDLKLLNVSGSYVASGDLTSSTFDTGSANDYQTLSWSPSTQPAQTGTNPVRFQIATNNDNATWDFKGPDGTSGTYYTTPGTSIASVHDGDQYLRYKVLLQTSNSAYTPTISDISFTYTSSCIPPGQVLFTGRGSGNHTLTVSKTGYASQTITVAMSVNEKTQTVTLVPN